MLLFTLQSENCAVALACENRNDAVTKGINIFGHTNFTVILDLKYAKEWYKKKEDLFLPLQIVDAIPAHTTKHLKQFLLNQTTTPQEYKEVSEF